MSEIEPHRVLWLSFVAAARSIRARGFQKSKARARRPHTSLFIQQLALTSTPLTLCPGLILPTPKILYLRMLGPDRSRRAMRAWQAALASFLFFAPSVTNAETIQISDDRGGFVIAYQMHWAMLAPENVNVRIAGPCVSACTILLGYIPRGRICVGSRASLGFHLATPDFVTQDLWRAYPLDIPCGLHSTAV
jgi:hypothetical protein